MAARITDRKRKKIIADYIELGSYNAVAKLNGVSNHTVKRIVLDAPEISEKIQQKKEENTADILTYMDSKRKIVCEIIGKGLDVLNDPQKLRDATPAQITTALGTLIDKWAMISGGPDDTAKEDDLSRSLRELGQELESDDQR